MALIKKQIFVCDDCGQRKRLAQSKRHWCENPSHRAAMEMRPTRSPAEKKRHAKDVGIGG
ncbi:MAG TPA: hypothetical protein VGQ82_03325 [Chthoniobacterales bacterium]|nr:hypothetical protein [Chthoniobacterales bacterium]